MPFVNCQYSSECVRCSVDLNLNELMSSQRGIEITRILHGGIRERRWDGQKVDPTYLVR